MSKNLESDIPQIVKPIFVNPIAYRELTSFDDRVKIALASSPVSLGTSPSDSSSEARIEMKKHENTKSLVLPSTLATQFSPASSNSSVTAPMDYTEAFDNGAFTGTGLTHKLIWSLDTIREEDEFAATKEESEDYTALASIREEALLTPLEFASPHIGIADFTNPRQYALAEIRRLYESFTYSEAGMSTKDINSYVARLVEINKLNMCRVINGDKVILTSKINTKYDLIIGSISKGVGKLFLEKGASVTVPADGYIQEGLQVVCEEVAHFINLTGDIVTLAGIEH